MSEIVKDNEVITKDNEIGLVLPDSVKKLMAVDPEELKKAYSKLYVVSNDITLEDEDEVVTLDLYFKKPKVVSFNRYIKSMSRDSLNATNDFVLDNIVKEQHAGFVEMLEEYPAASMQVVEKLLRMLGFAKSANFTKL